MNTRHKVSQLTLIHIPPVDETSIIHRKENNEESQAILDANRKRLSKQGRLLFRMMMSGIVITTTSAAAGIWFEGEKHIIGDIRTRISEFRKLKPVPVAFDWGLYDGRFKKYYMNFTHQAANKINFPHYLNAA